MTVVICGAGVSPAPHIEETTGLTDRLQCLDGRHTSLLKNGDWLRTTVENRGELSCCEVPVPVFQQADTLQLVS